MYVSNIFTVLLKRNIRVINTVSALINILSWLTDQKIMQNQHNKEIDSKMPIDFIDTIENCDTSLTPSL